MRRISYLIIFFLLSFAQAQNVDTLKVYSSTDSIVVIGNRISTSLRSLAYSYQTISGRQIEQLASHSLLEVVDMTFPSAFVLENKVLGYGVGVQGAGILNLRGIGGKPNTGVLVLVNGHPDFMGIFGHPLPDVYGMDDLQQVEVLAGPSSTVFGDHAMGGVVNLVTSPDYQHLATFQAEYGSFATSSYRLSLARKFNKHGFYLTVRKQKSDGHVKQSSFEALRFLVGWQYALNKTWKLNAEVRYVPYKFDDPARDKDLLNIGAYAKLRRGMAEISLQNFGQRLRGSFQLYANMGHHEFYDGFKSDDFNYGLSAYQFYQLNSKLSLAGGVDLLMYGGKAKNEFAKLPNGKPIVNPDAHDLKSAGIYAMAFYMPFPQFNLKAGVRYQYNSLPLSQFAPFAGASYTLANGLNIYANFQTGFRAPTLMELYLFPSANENLKEETVQSVEAGIAYENNGKKIRVAVFKNSARNLIQALPSATPPPPVVFQNGPSSDQWGVETFAQYRLNPAVILQLGYSYLEPDLLTAYNPKHQIKYGLFMTRHRFYLNLFGKYVQDLFAGNDKQMPLPDYNVMHLQVGAKWQQFDFYFRVLNVLDRLYYSRPDYPAPGRQFRFGVFVKVR